MKKPINRIVIPPNQSTPAPIPAQRPAPPMMQLPATNGQLIPATAFQCITFFEKQLDRQIVIIYALGADGIVREFVNGKWNLYPITA